MQSREKKTRSRRPYMSQDADERDEVSGREMEEQQEEGEIIEKRVHATSDRNGRIN